MRSRYLLVASGIILTASIATNGFAFAFNRSNGASFRLSMLFAIAMAVAAMVAQQRRTILTYVLGSAIVVISLFWLAVVVSLNGH